MIEGGVIAFVRADHIGRPVFATNSTGVKTWTATYSPFGGVHTSTGAPPSARFPGQWFQSESGLHQNWMRDYDPTTGRYLQADPLGLVDGASVYGYVKQSPMRFTDPTGQFIPQAAAAAAAFCVSNPLAALACAGAIVYTAYVVTDLCWETYIWLTKPGPGHNGGPPLNDGDDPPPNGPNGPNGPKGPKGPPIPPTWPDLKDPTKDPSKWVETQEQPRLDPKAKIDEPRAGGPTVVIGTLQVLRVILRLLGGG